MTLTHKLIHRKCEHFRRLAILRDGLIASGRSTARRDDEGADPVEPRRQLNAATAKINGVFSIG
jgi:hypothetical protein